MKNAFLVLFIVLLIIAGGLGAWYLLGGGGTDTPPVTGPSTSSNNSGNDTTDPGDTDTPDDSNCPTGVICLGSASIPTIPTIILGKKEVYAAENPPDSNQDIVDDQPDTPNVVKSITPQAVTISNKDFRIWSVSWVTKEETTGYLKYNSNAVQELKSIYDSRDEDIYDLEKRYTHLVSITNSDEELQQEGLSFTFTIISNGEEFDNNGTPFEYVNAPLTASPSLPNSVTVTSDRKAGTSDDYIVLARLIDADGDRSTIVSSFFDSYGEVDLIIGIARNSDLRAYFPYSASNMLEAKLYGPLGYTGYVKNVKLSDISEDFLSIQCYNTGYAGDIFASSHGSDYTIGQIPATTTTTTTTLPEQPDGKLPYTGVEDSWAFTSVFGFVIFLIGLLSVIVYVPWNLLNIRRMWEKQVVKDLDD
ncbi:MAG: hypothetical protein ABIE03_02550 [Patescibacteria group bacterium]|nr:hypothetical protein [Patescibacteria group bacterium]